MSLPISPLVLSLLKLWQTNNTKNRSCETFEAVLEESRLEIQHYCKQEKQTGGECTEECFHKMKRIGSLPCFEKIQEALEEEGMDIGGIQEGCCSWEEEEEGGGCKKEKGRSLSPGGIAAIVLSLLFSLVLLAALLLLFLPASPFYRFWSRSLPKDPCIEMVSQSPSKN